jgi:DNA-binding transcriptional MerR regulator
MRRKTFFSINTLLRESGYSNKTIKEILKAYSHHKSENLFETENGV